MNKDAQFYIDNLNLQPHPEGGYFKEIYRSDEYITADSLPHRYGASRNFSTSIYYLLNKTNISAFHILKSDEIWHFYAGSPLTIYSIDNSGQLKTSQLGNEPANNMSFQIIIPKNTWFAASVKNQALFTLAGCTVAPGFDFKDFTMAVKKNLIQKFPQHSQIIKELCIK